MVQSSTRTTPSDICSKLSIAISARLVLDTLEIVDLCVNKCVESVKILCVRKLDVPLSMDEAVEVIFDSYS